MYIETSPEDIHSILWNSYLAGQEGDLTRTNDSTGTIQEMQYMEDGYEHFCNNFDSTKLVRDVYPTLNDDLEFHYGFISDTSYYSSIYIPNFRTMNTSLRPIYACSYNLSSAYGENSIVGYYVDYNRDTITVLLDEDEAMRSSRPVLCYDFVDKAGSTYFFDSSYQVLDSAATGQRIDGANENFWFSRIKIAYRYENDNYSDVRAIYAPLENDNGAVIQYQHIKDIHKNNVGTLYNIWEKIWFVYNVDNDWDADNDNKVLGFTYERDWAASKKTVYVNNNIYYITNLPLKAKMRGSHEYYQIFALRLNDLMDGWYAEYAQKGLTWIHQWPE